MKIDEIERMKGRLATIAQSSENHREKAARSDVILMLLVEGLTTHLPQDMQAHVQEILQLHEQCWSPPPPLSLTSRGGFGEGL
jgi:hypothetical protein